ncbi:MAG: hypothetical protein OHK0053_34460 [Microscillaceae bacterium]
MALCLLLSPLLPAQKSRSSKTKETPAATSSTDRKALIAEIKAYQRNLEGYKALKEEDKTQAQKANEAKSQLTRLKADLDQATRELAKKDDAIAFLQEQLRKIRGEMGEVNATRQGRGQHDCAFSVQIGAYENRDLTQYMDKSPNFAVEQANGLKKYTLGYFTNYWEAKYFSKYLDNAGGQTYVVGYYKGQRVPDLKDMTQCTF